ncbi:hypothetical protein G7085_00365 [Tessaracoccus sp. HDW20]|nr:hypothetical protein [Tessaracoccus coleopterorum]NHB83672.1 hypothetical protein [Tessaracoccus coleopterorum]
MESSREPLRPIVDTPAALDLVLGSLASGNGDVAFDTERAHGHRYWPKAYLLQIRRPGAGTWLIDPVPFEGGSQLSRLVEVTGDAPWIIHAASQDLPCMQELGIVPTVSSTRRWPRGCSGSPPPASGRSWSARSGSSSGRRTPPTTGRSVRSPRAG